jgi:Cof subfamily protein (haloacid dehalogenase superfamily)
MKPSIELVAVDIDGTLLNNEYLMSERNEKVLKEAIDQGIKIILATGKTYASAKLIIERLELKTPGIYNQGLTVYKSDGTLDYQKILDPEIARQVITFAEDRGFSMVAYSGNRLLARTINPDTEQFHSKYHEPMPDVVGPLQNILGEIPINKILAVKTGEPKKITALRWQLDKQLNGKIQMTQALPHMLEVLPPGNSKGAALKTLLKQMNVDAKHVMAIGNAENDIGMLELAGVSVVVGNATQMLKDVADHVVADNDKDGVAEAIEKFVLADSNIPAAATSLDK